MPWTLHLVGAGGHNVFPSPLTTEGAGAGAEENRQAVLLRHPLQEPPEGPVALLLVALVGSGHLFGAGQNIFGSQGATLLVKTAVLRRLQALVLSIQLHESGSWGEGAKPHM